MTTPGTGYEDDGPDEIEGPVVFELVETRHLYVSRGTMGRLKRNGSSIGILYFDSQDEFEWVKRRLDGEFDIEIQQLNISGEET